MFEIFIACGAGDRAIAQTIARRLDRDAGVRVRLHECTVETLNEAWEGGVDSQAILLLLSPRAVPAAFAREEWDSLLAHLERRAEPPVACVGLEPCAAPPLLARRRPYFTWADDELPVLRDIEHWIWRLLNNAREPDFVPAALPWFAGREMEMEYLWSALVEENGTVMLANSAPGSGKSALAQSFARAVQPFFRETIWLACGDLSQSALNAALAAQCGVKLRGTTEEAAAALAAHCGDHRRLLILDDVRGALPFPLLEPLHGSVLATMRDAADDALPLEAYEPPPHREPSDPAARRLWTALAACRDGAAPVELAARIADIDHPEAAVAHLIECRVADPLDTAGRWMRLPSLTLPPVPADVRRAHAAALRDAFAAQRTNPARCESLLPELAGAARWTVVHAWPVAVPLLKQAHHYLHHQHRSAEALEVLGWLSEGADRNRDLETRRFCDNEFSWIRGADKPTAGPIEAEQLDLFGGAA